MESSELRRNLKDGSCVQVRPIAETDAEALVAFHESLTDRTRRYRFFTFHPHLTDDEIYRFTHVDHENREAFIALAEDRIVGVGRFDRTAPDAGEVAFVVLDAWQGIGLGTTLLNCLADWASPRGVTTFGADVLGDNRQMLTVFSHWSPKRKLTVDYGCVHLNMPLPSNRFQQELPLSS